MLWTNLNFFPALRTAFEIILAIPALLFLAALWTGCRQKRKFRDTALFRGDGEKPKLRNSNTEAETGQPKLKNSKSQVEDNPIQSVPISEFMSLGSPDSASRLSAAEFESALIQAEEARARGDHAAAGKILLSLHGKAPPCTTTE